jgi:hypothetical protein
MKDSAADRMLQNMAAWLKAKYPSDIIMPVRGDRKQPLFPHRDGSWSWDRFDSFVESASRTALMQQQEEPPDSYGILLREICAIDFDDEALALTFEAEFPCMARAPMETTRKGRHYLFRYPPWAREAGFFDGARQIEDLDVDFKAVCSTGTSGMLVTAPSPNKRWVRPPWIFEPFDIPPELLIRVARARPLRNRVSSRNHQVQHRQGQVQQQHQAQHQCQVQDPDSPFVRRVVLECLDVSRARSYPSWRSVGFALKLKDPGYLGLFKEFSRRSQDHQSDADVDACEILWNSAAGPGDSAAPTAGEEAAQTNLVTFATLCSWAKEDNPRLYREVSAEQRAAATREQDDSKKMAASWSSKPDEEAASPQMMNVMQAARKLHEILGLPSAIREVADGARIGPDKILQIAAVLEDDSEAVITLNCETLFASARISGQLEAERFLNDSQATALQVAGVDLSSIHKDLRPNMEWRVARPSETRAVFAAHGQNAQNATIELLNVNNPGKSSARLEFLDSRKTVALKKSDIGMLHSAYKDAVNYELNGPLNMGWVVAAIQNHGTINVFNQNYDPDATRLHTTDGAFGRMILEAVGVDSLGIVAVSCSEFFVWDRQTGLWIPAEPKIAADALRTTVQSCPAFWDALSPADRRYLDSQKGCQTLLDAILGRILNRRFREKKLDKLPQDVIPFDNGMFDFQTGTLRPFQREDYISQTIGYDFDASAAELYAHRVQEFYEQVLPIPEEREYFVQEISAALFAAQPAKHIIVLTDERDGSNGKTTLMRAVEAVFGSFTAATERSFLYSTTINNPNGHAANFLSYADKRLAFFDEPEPNMRLDMRKLKDLSSGDARIRGRGFHEGQVVDLTWQCLIVIACNEANFPAMDASDMPMVERLKALKMRSLFLKANSSRRQLAGDDFVFDMAGSKFKKDLNGPWRSAHFMLLADAYRRRYASEGATAPEPACILEMVNKLVESADPRISTALEFLDEQVDFAPERPEGMKGKQLFAYITEKELRARFFEWYLERRGRLAHQERPAAWKGPLQQAMLRRQRTRREIRPSLGDGKRLDVIAYENVAWIELKGFD